MTLKPHIGSDKAWVYHVVADYSDGEAKEDLLAIRFGSAESASPSPHAPFFPLAHRSLDAQAFKKAFEEGKEANEKIIAAAHKAAEKKDA